MIMVVLHPTGDPKDMKNRVGALRLPNRGNSPRVWPRRIET
jgi:hypothetical protein